MFYRPSIERYANEQSGHVAIDDGTVVGAALWHTRSNREGLDILPSAFFVAQSILGDRSQALGVGLQNARVGLELPPTPYLHDIAVLPSRQGQAVGSRLLATGLKEFGSHGCWLESTNALNHDFYRRAGFEKVHESEIGDSGVALTRMIRPGASSED